MIPKSLIEGVLVVPNSLIEGIQSLIEGVIVYLRGFYLWGFCGGSVSCPVHDAVLSIEERKSILEKLI